MVTTTTTTTTSSTSSSPNSVGPSILKDDGDETDEPPIRTHHPTHQSNLSILIFIFSTLLISQLLSPVVTISTSHLSYDRDHVSRAVVGIDSGMLIRRQQSNSTTITTLKHVSSSHGIGFDIQAVLIPILVCLSGIFAGLTLGYMSLDSTQLCVLAKSGTPEQQKLAKKIAPLRKDGHLLLITLLIANMIANETLPVVSDNVLGGGVQAVVVSTVLVIIFSEIIPQSVCSTYGLQIGAACAKPVQILVYLLFPICWPIAYLLNKILGSHSGIIYRRAELKELVNLHGSKCQHGGDLNQDVVTIVGGAIDLQERIVKDSMTRLEACFMLNVETRLDYDTLGSVLGSGHSRIPVYELVVGEDGITRRKILGALLTKQLILIDPEDGVPLRDFPLNPLPIVADNMPLLHILNSFQEGRSHLAIVCPSHVPKMAPFPIPLVPTSSSSSTSNIEMISNIDCSPAPSDPTTPAKKAGFFRSIFSRRNNKDQGVLDGEASEKPPPLEDVEAHDGTSHPSEMPTHTLNAHATSRTTTNPPVWPYKNGEEPIGIITLEDVLEQLLGEQIYDETDPDERGNIAVHPYVPPEAAEAMRKSNSKLNEDLNHSSAALIVPVIGEKPIHHKRWSFGTFRSSSMGRARGGPTACESQSGVNGVVDNEKQAQVYGIGDNNDQKGGGEVDVVDDRRMEPDLIQPQDIRTKAEPLKTSEHESQANCRARDLDDDHLHEISPHPPIHLIAPTPQQPIDLSIRGRTMSSTTPTTHALTNSGGMLSDAIVMERGRRSRGGSRGPTKSGSRSGSFKGPASSMMVVPPPNGLLRKDTSSGRLG